MTSLLLITVFGIIAIITSNPKRHEISPLPGKLSDKLGNLWEIAHQGMKENRLLRAEKALLTILNIDKKNAPAYNRLGILYAKQKEYKDAIDCFEIASSIEPTASSLHNLGLIYFETENYEKASRAFEQALKLEDQLAARHIAYAKVSEKLGDEAMMIKSLENAVELEPTKESLTLLRNAYLERNMDDKVASIQRQLDRAQTKSSKTPSKVIRSKRVVV